MKFNIPTPPMEASGREQEERLLSWLCALSESLNVTLSNLTEDNFSPSVKEKLFGKEEKEENNDNL